MSEETGDDAARVAALERKLAELEAQGRARLIQAELRHAAVQAGMVDLDGLKLIDTAAVKLGETGEVEGAAALMAEMKRRKPWLFGAAASSSSTAAAPSSEPPAAKPALQMSDADWRAARAALLRRR
jgi:hypothetical protein